jgi:hypothetical protein
MGVPIKIFDRDTRFQIAAVAPASHSRETLRRRVAAISSPCSAA